MIKKCLIISLVIAMAINIMPVSAVSNHIEIYANNYTLTKGQDVTYDDITVEDEGRYLLEISAKAAFETFLNVSLDGEMLTNVKIRQSDKYINGAAYANIPSGTHSLKLFCAGKAVTIDKITFTKVSDDFTVDETFLTALNTADSEKEVLYVFETYKESLGINLDLVISEVEYKKSVYMNMLGRDFENVDEVLQTLLDIAENEKRNPSVQLQKDGIKVSEASSGNLSIVIDNSRIDENSETFAALYINADCGKKLIASAKAVKQQNGNYVADFGNVVIPGDAKTLWNIFCFDNVESIRPYEPYGGIYKEIYVSATSGNDTYEGTQEKPFKTIKKAKEYAQTISENMAGDIVINIASGEYFLSETEVFTQRDSGRNGYNIVYKGIDENNPPVIHGGKKISGWTEVQDKPGIYSTTVSDAVEIRNLYIDGIAAERARSEWLYEVAEIIGKDTDNDYNIDGFITTSYGFPKLEKPQYAETVWEIMWRCQRIPIKSISTVGGETTVMLDNWYDETSSDNSSDIKKAGATCYIENDLSLLDTPGEFYFDRDTKKIYYYPYNEEKTKLNNIETVVGITEGLIKINGEKNNKVKNLVFDNIAIRYGAWNYVSEYGLIGQQSDSFYDTKNKSAAKMLMLSQFEMNFAENIEIVNCEFSSLGSAAVSMKDGVADVRFEGNVLKDISGTGIIVGSMFHGDKNYNESEMEICQNINIRNNVFRRIATEYRQNCAISTYYENAVNIEHNDILSTPYTGISTGWGWNGTNNQSAMCRNLNVSYNKITDTLVTLTDGGNIYNLGHSYEGKIANNYLAKNNKTGYPGIYLDAGSSYLNIHDNLVTDNEKYFLFIQRRNDFNKVNQTGENYGVTYNKVYDNYSDTLDYSESTPYTSPDTNVVERAMQAYDNGKLSDEAQAIFESAGLETKYQKLLLKKNITTPAYIRDYLKATPKHECIEEVNGKIIEFEDYESKTGGVDYEGFIGVSYNNSFTYNVEVDEVGFYDVGMYAYPITDNSSNIHFIVNNGDGQYSSEFSGTKKTWEYNTLTSIYLEKTNTITVTLKNDAAMHIDYLTLKPSDEVSVQTILLEAESPQSTNVSANQIYSTAVPAFIGFSEGKYISYNVTSNGAKTYDVYVRAATKADAKLGFTRDGRSIFTGTFKKTGDTMPIASAQVQKVGQIALANGSNTVKITVKSGEMHLDYILLRETSAQ